MRTKRYKNVIMHKGLKCGKSQTIQAPSEVTDINQIVERAKRGEMLSDPRRVNAARTAMYGDFTSSDYEQAQLQIASVKSSFEGLPAQIREEFENDPKQLLNALASEDPEVVEFLQELGLKPTPEAPEEPKIQRVEIVNPEPEPSEGDS